MFKRYRSEIVYRESTLKVPYDSDHSYSGYANDLVDALNKEVGYIVKSDKLVSIRIYLMDK